MATILKGKQFPEGINRAQIEVFNWEDVAARAREYLKSVREQADVMLNAAKLESLEIRETAKQDGIHAGQQDVQTSAATIAERLAADRIAHASKQIAVLGTELEEATHRWLRQWQHETIPLSVAIAERLVRRQIDADPAILLQWLNDAVRLVQGSHKCQLKMNSRDVEVLGESLPRTIRDLSHQTPIELIIDDSVESNGIILQTSDSRIDLQLSAQLDRLSEELQ